MFNDLPVKFSGCIVIRFSVCLFRMDGCRFQPHRGSFLVWWLPKTYAFTLCICADRGTKENWTFSKGWASGTLWKATSWHKQSYHDQEYRGSYRPRGSNSNRNNNLKSIPSWISLQIEVGLSRTRLTLILAPIMTRITANSLPKSSLALSRVSVRTRNYSNHSE